MKRIIPLLLGCFFASVLLAQKNNDNYYESKRTYKKEETLFNTLKLKGGFGGPIFEYSYVGEDYQFSSGGGGGLVFRNFFIGLYGMGVIDESFFDEDIESIEMGHGGLWLGFAVEQHKLLHLYGGVRTGWGAMEIDLEDEFFEVDDAVFVTTPELGLELNVFRFFRVAATAGYRWVDGINESVSGLESDALNGFVTTLTLRFGVFGRRW